MRLSNAMKEKMVKDVIADMKIPNFEKEYKEWVMKVARSQMDKKQKALFDDPDSAIHLSTVSFSSPDWFDDLIIKNDKAVWHWTSGHASFPGGRHSGLSLRTEKLNKSQINSAKRLAKRINDWVEKVSTAREQLSLVINSCTTDKQLWERLPRLEKYFPKPPEKPKLNLPTCNTVVDSLKDAGLPLTNTVSRKAA